LKQCKPTLFFVVVGQEAALAKENRNLSPEARLILKKRFAENYERYPTVQEKNNLAQEAGLATRQVGSKLRLLIRRNSNIPTNCLSTCQITSWYP
jgi:hypothetical protein